MTFQPVPDTVQAIIEWSFGTTFWTNTLHFERANFTQAEMEALGDELLTWADVEILPAMADFTFLEKVTLYGLNSVTDFKVTRIPDPKPSGSRLGAVMNVNGALVVTFRTGVRGRSGRGRNYLTGFMEEDVTAISVATPQATAVQTAYSNLIARVGALGWTWVVVSRQQAGVVLPNGVTYPVNTVEVRSENLGSQRRRIERG